MGHAHERDAWEKLRAWAEPKGLHEDLENHPVFGFTIPVQLRKAKNTATSFGTADNEIRSLFLVFVLVLFLKIEKPSREICNFNKDVGVSLIF
jgi:hypothetical protein